MSLFTKVDVVSNDISLPSLARADVEFLSELEELAYDHWIFDLGSSDSLVGRVNGVSLVPDSVEPNYNEKSIGLFTGVGKHLRSGITDVEAAGSSGFTVFVCFKSPAGWSGLNMLMGNWNNSGDGFSIDLSNGGLTARDGINQRIDLSVSPGQWVGAFLTVDTSSGQLLFFMNSLNKSQIAYAGSMTAGLEICLGNARYTSGGDVEVEVADAGIIPRPHSMAELEILYNAAKKRMAARGINII